MNNITHTQAFSVLLSVYHRDQPEYLQQALNSIYQNQTLKPNEIIIIKDGTLPECLNTVIDRFKNTYPQVVKLHTITQNKGLGNALNIGVNLCQNELIARMDADDISYPDRFEKQVSFMMRHPSVDVLGGQITEFNTHPGDLKQYRYVPLSHQNIIRFAKQRSPMNHPSVMMRKSSVLSAGNYDAHLLLWEDYMLWVKMLKKGYRFHNLDDFLLHFRVSNLLDMIRRRRGRTYTKNEFKFACYAYRIGFFSKFDFLRYVITRPLIKLLPESLLAKFYTVFLRK